MQRVILPSLPGVYLIANTVNGSYYVGSSNNMYRRCNEHLSHLRRGKHSNKHLQSAYNLYGEDAFVFSMLEHVPNPQDLIFFEQQHMDKMLPKYNLNPAAGNALGHRHSPETKAKLRASHLGKDHRKPENKPRRPETRAKMREAWKLRRERPTSQETRLKRSRALMDRKQSEETRAKKSATHTALWQARRLLS